jgi:hypothetical protein
MRHHRAILQNVWPCTAFLLGLLSCAPKSEGLDTLFAITRNLIGNQHFAKDSLLLEILDGSREIRVCLINESPEKNAAWLDKVSGGFEGALNAWIAAGSKHPRYPFPKSLRVKFTRYSAEEALIFEGLDEASQRKMFREYIDLYNQSKRWSDDEFRRDAGKFGQIQRRYKSSRDLCAKPVVKIETFSQESAYREFLRKSENPFRSISNNEMAEIDQVIRLLKERHERVALGYKLTSREHEEKNKLKEADSDSWLTAGANFLDSSINFNQVPENESRLRLILLHEVGHLFGLGDVYPEQGSSALAIHPASIMKASIEFGANLQADDIAGLHAVISLAKQGIKTCGEGYSEFNNDADSRSVYDYYCLPQGYQPGFTHHGQQRAPEPFGIGSDKSDERISKCPSGSVYNQISMLCEVSSGSTLRASP